MWRDWHSSGVQFAGRLHKVDAVLLTREIEGMEYVDVLFEFKRTLATDAELRDVVLQLVNRMYFVFEAHALRQRCWGVAMDSRRCVLVCCDRSLQVWVSLSVSLLGDSGLSLLAKFLSGPPTTRDYVSAVLPSLWGKEAVCCLAGGEGCAVFGMDEKVVAKVGVSEFSIARELETIRELQNALPSELVCPRVVERELATGNAAWPYGFQMARLNAVSVESEAGLVCVIGGALWRLAVVHELGYVHGDVKPSNLLARDAQVLLCDFGHAKRGDGRESKGGTEAFRVIDGLFEACEFQCDLEGLYWAALTLWLQVKSQKPEWKGLIEDERRREFSLLHLYEANRKFCPRDPVLFAFLCKQAKARTLINPVRILRSVPARLPVAEWKKSVREIVEQQALPQCPEEVLEWFARRLGMPN